MIIQGIRCLRVPILVYSVFRGGMHTASCEGKTSEPEFNILDTDFESQGWELFYRGIKSCDDHVCIFRRPLEGSPTVVEYRVNGCAPTNLNSVFQTLTQDLKYRKKWDTSVGDLRIISKDDKYKKNSVTNVKELVYWVVQWPWPLSNRAYLYERKNVKCFENGKSSIICTFHMNF